MKKLLSALILGASFSTSYANGIDTGCPSFTYKSAPVVKADQYICHKMYGIAYNYTTKTPIYTTEYLAADHTGNAARTNDFRVDPEVPKQYSATLKDYAGAGYACNGGRCDRGHMTPDQDFSATHEGVSESFFMSNMIPQNYQNNEIIWKYMEMKIRDYVAQKNPVYVITGPIYTIKPYKTIGNGVAVPDSLFKVVIDAKDGHSIAFMMPNANFPVGTLNGKIVSLKVIENATGMTFDKSLDKKKSASYQEWFSNLK